MRLIGNSIKLRLVLGGGERLEGYSVVRPRGLAAIVTNVGTESARRGGYRKPSRFSLRSII